MATIYSKRWFTGRVNLAVGATSVLFTVPSGSVGLVYAICLFNPGGATKTDTRFQVLPSGGTAIAFWATSPASLASDLFEGRLVLESGDALRLRATTAGDYDVNVFGQELVEL